MRPFTVVEAASAFAVGGSLLAIGVPAFVEDLHASRLVEPVEGLRQLGSRASLLAMSHEPLEAYPPSAPLTPAQVPRGEQQRDPEGAWRHPTWLALRFGQEAPHSFSFAFESSNGPRESVFRAVAHGDLDGDGVWSTFELSGGSEAGGEPHVGALQSELEVE